MPSHIWLKYHCMWRKTPLNSTLFLLTQNTRLIDFSFLRFQYFINNKHSESIAKAIQVPYRPQQISKRHNCYKNRSTKQNRESTEGYSELKIQRVSDSAIGCFTSHATIFQFYMWRHIDVQVDWRSWTYGRASKNKRNNPISSNSPPLRRPQIKQYKAI